MKDVDAQSDWISDIGVKGGIDIIVCVSVGFQKRIRKDNAANDKDISADFIFLVPNVSEERVILKHVKIMIFVNINIFKLMESWSRVLDIYQKIMFFSQTYLKWLRKR